MAQKVEEFVHNTVETRFTRPLGVKENDPVNRGKR